MTYYFKLKKPFNKGGIDLSGKISKQELSPALKQELDKSGNLASLTTTDKSSLVGAVNEIDGDILSHKAQNVTEQIQSSRDLTVAGTQTIALSTSKTPKKINIIASIAEGIEMSMGSWCEETTSANGRTTFIRDSANPKWSNTPRIIRLAQANAANRVDGALSNVQEGAFDVIWSMSGTGVSGTVTLIIDVLYHE